MWLDFFFGHQLFLKPPMIKNWKKLSFREVKKNKIDDFCSWIQQFKLKKYPKSFWL